jgi:spore coat protein U-like protein
MRNSIVYLSASALLALAGTALAAPPNPATTNIGVSATVTKNCTVGATAVAFGAYYPTAGALVANSTVSVNCTKTTPFQVSLNKGTTAGGSLAQRLLTDGAGNTLQYNLYKDAALSIVWGDNTGGTQWNTGVGAGMATAVTFTAYGSLPDIAFNQGAQPPGLYTDVVTVSVAY